MHLLIKKEMDKNTWYLPWMKKNQTVHDIGAPDIFQ
jgi:hypothetical protein